MANVGKYVDRAPKERAAGLATPMGDSTVCSDMQIYSTEEVAEEMVKAKCQDWNLKTRYRPAPTYAWLPPNQMLELLTPELQKSRFVAFREELSEKMYFKSPALGCARELDTKPKELTNENNTFGMKYPRSDTLYDVVLPNISVEEVNRNYIDKHDIRLLSHNRSLPAEQFHRPYARPAFDPKATFGMKGRYDINGANMKRSLQTCDPVLMISKVQKEFLQRVTGQVGLSHSTHCSYLKPDATYGRPPSKSRCTVRSLMENTPNTPCKSSILAFAIAHINKWRHCLFKRDGFHTQDLRLKFQAEDTERTGYLPLSVVRDITHSFGIYLDDDKLCRVLRHLGMVKEPCASKEEGGSTELSIKHGGLWELLTIQFPIPSLGRLEDTTSPNEFDTTYRLFCRDADQTPSPGVKSTAHRDPTTVKDLVQREIPITFGIDQLDFQLERDKTTLRRIFKSAIPDEKLFDEIWLMAQVELKRENELISVAEFRAAANEYRRRQESA